MTFLAPAFLWGLIAASIPLIIHLISLRNTKSMDFSSIRILEELKHESIRKLKIKQWLLILIRTAAIIALVLLVSRPVTQGLVSGWISGEAESRAIIILDNSASMSLKPGQNSLLEQSKIQAKTFIRQLHNNSTIEIYQTNPLQILYEGKNDRAEIISSSINEIEQSTLTDNLWYKLTTILSEVEEHEVNLECYVFSDLQTIPDTTTINRLYSDKLKHWLLYFIGQEMVANNIGIYEVTPASQVKLPNHLMKLNTLVVNEGKHEQRNIPIELYLNEERVGQVVTGFKPEKSKEFLFQAYPGKSGVVRGKMTIPTDDFLFDNEQTFELSIPEKISVMLVGTSVEDVFILEEALKSISGENETVSIMRKVLPTLEKLILDDIDILLLHKPEKLSTQVVEDIQRFSERGGGLIWISSAKATRGISENTESVLKLPTFVQSLSAVGDAYYSVRQNEKKHSLFADLIVRKMAKELPEVFQYRRVQPRLNQQIILSLNNGDPYLLEYKFIGGQVFYFTSPIGLEWNDLALRGLFVPLLHRMLILLATDENNTSPIIAGEEKVILIPKGRINSRWEVYSPSGKRSLLIPDYNNEILAVEKTSELGSYEIYADDKQFSAFSTKMNPIERPGNRVSGKGIAELIGENRAKYIEPQTNISKTINNVRYGKSLWRNFLILTIILLLLDLILSRPNAKSIKSIQ